MTIVTLTSFPQRMFFVPKVLESIYSQTRLPDAVVLHLSEEEFPVNGRWSMVNYLAPFIEKGLLLRFHDGNERCWKKLIPTMQEWPEAEIISIDDDIIYPPYFVERLTDEYRANGCRQPMTCGHCVWRWYGGIYTHYGCFSLTQAKFHAPQVFDLWKEIRPIVLENRVKTFDDELYTHTALLNGVLYKPCSMNLNPLRKEHRLPCPVSHTAGWRNAWNQWNGFIHDLILKRYGVDTQERAQELTTNTVTL